MGKKKSNNRPGPVLTANIRELLQQSSSSTDIIPSNPPFVVPVTSNDERQEPSASSSQEVDTSSELVVATVEVPIYETGENLGDVRPRKKLRQMAVEGGFLGPGLERYDATGLVPHYTQKSQVPPHLQKYFAQRKRYFSLYSEGCLLDEEGWYSVTPEKIADQIAERCRCGTILDAFCGVGGNAIGFAKTCERVIALDISPVRLALARHNAALYGVADRIEFILADFTTFVRSYLSLPNSRARKIDAVFLSPPWGGPSYLDPSVEQGNSAVDNDIESLPSDYSLASVLPLPGDELFALARKITPHVAYFLPRNMNVKEMGALIGDAIEDQEGRREKVEIEEEWMGNKLKALTCYFGGLAAGQEWMWPE